MIKVIDICNMLNGFLRMRKKQRNLRTNWHKSFPVEMCWLLEGDLGAGKTAFTKGLAKGLGVTRMVNSPTFTIIKEYMGSLPLYHMDVYRVSESEEDLGFDEYFEGDGVTVVEWAHLIKDHLPEEILTIYIYRLSDTSRLLFW